VRGRAQLARDGSVVAARRRRAGGREPFEESARLGRELDALDRMIAEHGGAQPDTAVLTQLFKFGKENLEDADVATLAAATRTLYDELARGADCRSEEHTSELQSPDHLVCRLLLEKKKRHGDSM